jgi:hypothetical protein
VGGRDSLTLRRLTTRAGGSILSSVVGADGEEDHDFGGEGEREKIDKSELASL